MWMSFTLGASAAVHALPWYQLDERRALKSDFTICFAWWTDSPPSTLEHLLRFPFSCYIQKGWGKDFTACFNSSFNHFIGCAVGEFTSGGDTNTSHLSGLMLSISDCKQISKSQIENLNPIKSHNSSLVFPHFYPLSQCILQWCLKQLKDIFKAIYIIVFYKDIFLKKPCFYTSYSVVKNVLDCGIWERTTSIYFNKPQSEGVQVIFLCFPHINSPLINCTLGRSAD